MELITAQRKLTAAGKKHYDAVLVYRLEGGGERLARLRVAGSTGRKLLTLKRLRDRCETAYAEVLRWKALVAVLEYYEFSDDRGVARRTSFSFV